jgi:hypothetical protein
MAKILIEIDLDKTEMAQICQNSIERLMNNAITVGEFIQSHTAATHPQMSDRGSTLWQDCEELKALNTKLWDVVRNEIFKQALR